VLDNQTSLLYDLGLARKLTAFRKQVEENFKNDYLVTDFWNRSVAANGAKASMIMIEDDGRTRSFTFSEVDALSNQLAHLLLSKGITRGDTVALFMENRPEFVVAWLGVTKIGAKCAMINTSIVQKGLAHCINISGAKALIFGLELESALAEITGELTGAILLCQGGASRAIGSALHLDPLLAAQPKTPPPAKLREGIKHSDVFGYIYTSGAPRSSPARCRSC